MLVVIDMQYEFLDWAYGKECNKVKEEVVKEINKAKGKNEVIIIVGLSGCGRTVYQINRAVRRYPLLNRVTKWDSDGTPEIIQAIKKAKRLKQVQRIRKIKYCGVYTNCCVAETMLGMCRRMPNTKMELIPNACWDGTDASNSLKTFKFQAKGISNITIAKRNK